MDDTQYGFRPGRSTTGQNFNLQQTLEKSRIYGTDVFRFFRWCQNSITGLLEKRFEKFYGNTVFTACCYSPSNHCIPAQKNSCWWYWITTVTL